MAKKVSKVKKEQHRHQTEKAKQKDKAIKGKLKPSKVFVYALAIAALGGGGYLVYDRLKKRKADTDAVPPTDDEDTTTQLPAASSASSSITRLLSSASKRNDNFPLKRGSRGERVKILQRALAKTSPTITIDGQFGPGTAAALKAAGYNETVDETLFTQITGQAQVTVVFDPVSLSKRLYAAAQAKDLTGVLTALKQIKSVADYTSVNEYYKKQSFISKTIVTDLLEYAFKYDESAKEKLRNEFLRMGLKNNGTSWSLQGIRLYKDLITLRATTVTDGFGNKIPVRRNTILGDEVKVSSGMTWFRSVDNSILSVPTQDVKLT
jgi:hypothetical protein